MSTRVDPSEAALAGLASAQELAAHTHDTVRELRELVREQAQPPSWRLVTLEPSRKKWRENTTPAPAIAVANPSALVVRVALAGGTADPGAQGFPVAANAWVVLPGWWEDEEFGPDDPALLVAPIALYVARFKSVQPFAAGRLS